MKFQPLNIDGTKTSDIEISDKLVKLKVNLASLKRRFVDKNAPEIIIVDDQIRELKNQIEIEKNMLVDPDGKNFSNKILEMEELKNKRDYVYELYITSLKAAEKATDFSKLFDIF